MTAWKDMNPLRQRYEELARHLDIPVGVIDLKLRELLVDVAVTYHGEGCQTSTGFAKWTREQIREDFGLENR